MNNVLSRTEIDVMGMHILTDIMNNTFPPQIIPCRSMAGSAISVSGHIERGSGSLSRLPSLAFAPPLMARLSKLRDY